MVKITDTSFNLHVNVLAPMGRGGAKFLGRGSEGGGT